MPPTKYTPANNAIAKARFLKESKNPALDISKKAKMAKTIDDYNPRKNDWKGVDTPGSKTLQQQKKAWIQHVMDTHAAMGGSLKEAMIAASKTWRKKGASKVKKSSSGKKVAFAKEAPVSVPLPELDTSYVSELTDLESMYQPKPKPDTSYVDELNDLEAAYKPKEGVPKPIRVQEGEAVPLLSDTDYANDDDDPEAEPLLSDKAAESRRKYEDKGVTLEDVREFGGGFNDDVREFGGGFNVPPPVSLPLPALTSFFGGVDDDEWGDFQSGGPALDEWGEFQSAVPTQPPQDAPKKQQTFKQWLQEKRIRENEQKAALLKQKNQAKREADAIARAQWEKEQARRDALHKIDVLKIQNERAVNKAIQESSAPPISPGMFDDNDVDDDVPELVPQTDTFIVRKAPVSIPLPILKQLEPYQVQLGLYPEVTPVPSSPFPTTTLWPKKNALIDSLQSLPVNTEEPRGPGGSVPMGFKTDTECDKLTGKYKQLCEQRSLAVQSEIPKDDERLPLDMPPPPLRGIPGEVETYYQEVEPGTYEEGFIPYEETPLAKLASAKEEVQLKQYKAQLGVTDEEFVAACAANEGIENMHLRRAIQRYFKTPAMIYEHNAYPKYKPIPKSGDSRNKMIALNKLNRNELCVLIAYTQKRKLRQFALSKNVTEARKLWKK